MMLGDTESGQDDIVRGQVGSRCLCGWQKFGGREEGKTSHFIDDITSSLPFPQKWAEQFAPHLDRMQIAGCRVVLPIIYAEEGALQVPRLLVWVGASVIDP